MNEEPAFRELVLFMGSDYPGIPSRAYLALAEMRAHCGIGCNPGVLLERYQTSYRSAFPTGPQICGR